MAGLFLSYSRADRALADQIVRGLRALGVDAWWDEDMRGVDWQQELEHRINDLAGVVVIWTEHSVESVHVRDEARLALGKDKLINVMAGVRAPPFPYDRINGLPLDGWSEREAHRGWSRLVETVEEMVVHQGGARPGDITVALAMREQAIHERQKAVGAAQRAIERAQTHGAEAEAESKAAEVALEHAQEQLQNVAQMRISPTLLKAAQQEFDAALTAKTRADEARRKARDEFERASTALSAAMEALEGLFQAEVEAPPLPARRVRPAAAGQPVIEPPTLPPEPPPEAPFEHEPLRFTAEAATPAEVFEPTAPPRPTRSPAASRTPLYALAGAGVVAVIIVGVVLTIMPHGAPAPSTPAPSVLTAQAATPAPGSALVGRWTTAGIGCDEANAVSVSDGELVMAGALGSSSFTIEPGSQPDQVKALGDGGVYTYALRKGALVITSPQGVPTRMTRCAG